MTTCRTSWCSSPRASSDWATRRSRGLTGTVERRGGIWQTAKLRANIEDSKVSLDVNTANRQTAASPARQRCRLADPRPHAVRQRHSRRHLPPLGQPRPAPAAISGDGDLKIRNFTLWGAPTIARIISLASFSGLSNALSGRGVPVTRLVVPFRLQDEMLTIEQARLVGQQHRRACRRDDRFRRRPPEHHRHGGTRLHGQPDPRPHPDHRPDPVRLAARMRRWPPPSASPAPLGAAAGQRQSAGRPGARHDPRSVQRVHRRRTIERRQRSTSAERQAGRTSTWRLRPAESLMWPSRTAAQVDRRGLVVDPLVVEARPAAADQAAGLAVRGGETGQRTGARSPAGPARSRAASQLTTGRPSMPRRRPRTRPARPRPPARRPRRRGRAASPRTPGPSWPRCAPRPPAARAASISSSGSSVNSRRKRPTSASSVLRQNCQYSNGVRRSCVQPDRPGRGLAHLLAGGRGDQRRGQAEQLAAVDPAAELDAVDDVAPLVGAAHLQPAAVAARQLEEVVGLHHHVVELEQRQRLLALEPQLHRIEGQHAVDGEVRAEVAQERDVAELVQPLVIVDQQRAAGAEVEKLGERALDAALVGVDLLLGRAAAGSRPCPTGRRPWSCRRRPARSAGGRSAAGGAAS